MKRAFSLLVLMIVLLLLVQWGSTFFKKNHQVTYQIISEDITFEVKEDYQKEDTDSYQLEIKHNNNTFLYTISNLFNKQKKIVKSIEVYKTNTALCIFPVFEKMTSANIECLIDNNLYSYEAIKNREEVTSFTAILKEKGYQLPAWEVESTSETKSATSIVYNDNLLEEDIITIWNYKALDAISKNNNQYYPLNSYDKYENKHGMLVGKYYVVPVYINDRIYDFNELNIINLETQKVEKMNLNNTLKQDTYINGVVDGKLYYFDPDQLLQIEINPSKKTERVVGNQEINAQYYNGKWMTTNIYDFVNQKKTFELDYSQNELLNKYQPTKVLETNTNYYYLQNDGSLYRLNKNNLEVPILLFQRSNIKELKIKGNTLYFLIGDTLYLYQEEYGIRKIVKNSEWNYNSTNIIDIYKKPN